MRTQLEQLFEKLGASLSDIEQLRLRDEIRQIQDAVLLVQAISRPGGQEYNIELLSAGTVRVAQGTVILDKDGIAIQVPSGDSVNENTYKFMQGGATLGTLSVTRPSPAGSLLQGNLNLIGSENLVQLTLHGSAPGGATKQAGLTLDTLANSRNPYITVFANDADYLDFIQIVTNALRVSGAYIELAVRSSSPTTTPQNGAANIYLKGSKLIVQYDDVGTIRYKYLDLAGTGVTWVHTTVAP